MKPGQGTSYLRPRTSFPFPSVYRHSRIVSPPLYFRLETNCGQIFPISNDSQRWLANSIPSRLFLEQVRPFYRFVYIKRAYRNRIGNQQFSSSFLNQGRMEKKMDNVNRNFFHRRDPDFRGGKFLEPLSPKERGKIVEAGARSVGALRVTGTGRNDMERRAKHAAYDGKTKEGNNLGQFGGSGARPARLEQLAWPLVTALRDRVTGHRVLALRLSFSLTRNFLPLLPFPRFFKRSLERFLIRRRFVRVMWFEEI